MIQDALKSQLKHELFLVIAITIGTALFGLYYLSPLVKGNLMLMGDKHLYSAYVPVNSDGTINVIVENPAGTLAKWEVDLSDGVLKRELKPSGLHSVSYLAYPGNYGMIPGTIMSRTTGGDGDPLDVLILGSAHPRGSVVKARVIGVLKMFDQGDWDDKIIALDSRSAFNDVNTIQDLVEKYPGVAEIIDLWFKNYKGAGEITTHGYLGIDHAWQRIHQAITEAKLR